MKTKVVIIGAGPAGLTAGYLLSKEDVDVVVLEADPGYVGGISRTVTYKGFHFDIGGTRFFLKFQSGGEARTRILPNENLVCPPASRTFFRRTAFLFTLPLIFEALVTPAVLNCLFRI